MARSQHISPQSRQALASSASRLKAAAVVGPATVTNLDTILAACRAVGGGHISMGQASAFVMPAPLAVPRLPDALREASSGVRRTLACVQSRGRNATRTPAPCRWMIRRTHSRGGRLRRRRPQRPAPLAAAEPPAPPTATGAGFIQGSRASLLPIAFVCVMSYACREMSVVVATIHHHVGDPEAMPQPSLMALFGSPADEAALWRHISAQRQRI